MRSFIRLILFTLTYLAYLPIVISQAQAQVYLFPPPPVRPGNAAPTLSGEQAHAVIQHHLAGADGLADKTAPPDHGLWGHFMGLWDGKKRPKVVIVEGADAQHVFGGTAPQPTFYLDPESESALDEFFDAARAAVQRVLELPLVKNLLDTLDWAVKGGSKALAEDLTALVALADNLWSQASAKWDAVAVRLSAVTEGSALWTQAVDAVRAGVQSMTAPEDSGPVVLVIMPQARGGRHYRRQVEADKKKGKDGKKGKGKHEDKNVSAQFVILAGTTLLLVLAALAAIALLFSLGGESLPSSLNLAPGK